MEETPHMIFSPEEEGDIQEIKSLLAVLQDNRFSAEILNKIYKLIQEDQVQSAATLIAETLSP